MEDLLIITPAFLDTETLGLDPDRHAVWEVGVVIVNPDGSIFERLWQLRLSDAQVAHGDERGMDICRFHERYRPETAVDVDVFLNEFVLLTAGDRPFPRWDRAEAKARDFADRFRRAWRVLREDTDLCDGGCGW